MTQELIQQAADTHARYVDHLHKTPAKRAFIAGAKHVLASLWQEDTDDESVLPPIEKDTIVLFENEMDGRLYATITFRGDKTVSKYSYGKGGWNIPNVKYFLNVELPKND